ncbi:MAG TPA: hypothetical protein HPP64_04565 [Gammaproteobacteria bacterium]|jgi:hypothetical protein|nr:hypothetical protein [Gammaproteobacteria bacterium]MBT7328497.1 hypothetical protein [Gammaproteobacteria bacterium]HIJ22176.1 hypothetical protein [Gammaproteobacteria bacterium]
MIDLNTESGCRQFLVDRRFSCRTLIPILDQCHNLNLMDRREARKLRQHQSPIFDRRADVLEKRAKQRWLSVKPVGIGTRLK